MPDSQLKFWNESHKILICICLCFHSIVLSTCEKPFNLETQIYQSLEHLMSIFVEIMNSFSACFPHRVPSRPLKPLDFLDWASNFLFIVSYTYLRCNLLFRRLFQVYTNWYIGHKVREKEGLWWLWTAGRRSPPFPDVRGCEKEKLRGQAPP